MGRTKRWNAGVLRLLPIAALFALLALFAFPSTGLAAGNMIVVTTTADDDTAQATDCTLRDAIASANTDAAVGGCASGVAGSDTIDVSKGTYFLDTGQLLISSDLDLVGAGARSTIISGSDTGQRDIEISGPDATASVTIDGVTIENGSTSTGGQDSNAGVGGGIWVDSTGALTLQDSMVIDNHADGSGGGIDSDGSLTVVRSTIENNQAGCGVINCGFGIGGGIDHFGSSLSITNSTIAGNAAQGDGGGLYVGGPNTVLTNATIANNVADQGQTGENGGGGIAVALGGTAAIGNTLLAGNTWNGDGGNCSNGITSLGGNLADDVTCALTGATDQAGVDAQLGSIDTSGPTDVLPLTVGSPAIDAANDLACPATDQRGIARPQGPHCDIGAFEAVQTSIAFESNRTGNSQIWTMNPDGSNVAQLTRDPSTVTDSLPSISPDGHTVVYQRTSGGVTQIWAIDGDGGNPRQLTSLGSNSQPTFSPDGTKIAFDSTRTGSSQLFVMNADGSGQTRVMTMGGSVGGSSWSPDGSQIAFNDDTTGSNQIYTVNVATGTVSAPLTSTAQNRNPHWSPDGSEILFVSSRCTTEAPICGGGESVYLMNADGSNQQNLTDAPIFDADPAWAPDGSRIAFVRDLGGQNFNVFTAKADGTSQVQLTNGGAPSRNSFPNWGTRVSAVGQLLGSFDQSVVKPVDLTAAGNSDWALWGYNSTATDQPASALTPNETKANGGRQISDLSIVNGDGTATRGFGSFADDQVPYNFSWTDGAPAASVSGGHAGLTAPKVGQGLSFTVPAGRNPRTLTIWTSAHYADGTLTAHLSDGSAPDYTQTIHAVAGDPFPGENSPATFRLRYAAASPGQQLTVTWTQSANNACGGCEDVVIYAAALSGPLSNLKVNVTPSSAGAGIDRVTLAQIPNAFLSFYAGSTSSTPVGSTPVGSTPVGSTPVGSTPVGSTPVGSTPVGSTPVGSTPVGSTPVGSTGLLGLPVGSTPVGSTPVGSTALSSLLLSQIPLCGDVVLPGTDQTRCQTDGATWNAVLDGTPLAGRPLNALTLADVVGDDTSKARLAALPLKDVSFATTLFRTVHWSSLLLGSTPLSDLPGGFTSWCGTGGLIPANGGSCTNATPDTSVLQMDVGGQLGSAPVGSTPVGSTPVGSTPVGSTPVGSTDVSASLLANIPLSDIADHDGDLAQVVTCGPSFDCTGKTLGDASKAAAILPTAKFSNIAGAMAADGITYNDVLIAILGAAGLPWEQLPIQGLQPYSATPSKVTYTISTDVDCSSAPEFTITAHLPDGFFPVDGSAQVAVGNGAASSAGAPNVLGDDVGEAQKLNSYRWTVDCPAGDTATETATLTFDSWVGLDLGTFTTHVTAATASSSISTTDAPVTVHQNPEASDSSSATEINPDTLVAGHIAFSGQQAFYKVNLSGLARGTRIQAFLNVPSGADLDLTMSAPAAPSFFSTPVGSTPVGSTPIEDSSVGFSSSGLALPPDTLQDVPVGSTPVGSTPVGSTPVGSTSANRGAGVNEAGGIITSGQTGYVTIGVSGYNGATSKKPYVLRVQETPPPALPPNCPARTFPNGSPSSFTAGTLPSSLPTSTKTLFVVDKQRLLAMYPTADVNNMLTALGTLAARSEVSGSILYVDGDAGVRNAYAAWDAKDGPCNATLRNNVVKSINDVVASYRNSATGLPNLHYVVLVGSDEAGPPMADAPDPVFLSPEENEASDLAFTTSGLTQDNALYASAAQNYILTDGAYGAFTNIPWLGRSLLLPQISVSRLVETPTDILGQINRYLGTNGISAPQSAAGTLNPTTALVTGYDFLADGARAVHDNLKANFSGLAATESLASGAPAIDDPGTPWKAGNTYATGAIVHPTSPGGLSFMAQTGGVSGSGEPTWPLLPNGLPILDNGISWVPILPWSASDVLSSALQSAIPPSIVSIDAHYNQYELEAASRELATSGQATTTNLAARILFTMGCHGGLNISDSLLGGTTPPTGKYLDWPELYAQKQAAMYIANTGYGYGDTESVALSERLLALFAKNLHSDSGSVGEEWVNALQQYFATAGAYDVYDEKVMEETTFYGLPFWHFSTAGTTNPTPAPLATSADAVTGTQSATITFPGTGATTQSQFGLYRPNLPITSQEVTSTLPARGVWITGLHPLFSTETPTNATIGYPTIDLSAHEPAPSVSPIFFPASPFTLEHSLVFGKERDYLNVSDQFRATGPGNAGVQRHFTGGTFEIFYSQSSDQVAPLISQVNVSTSGGVATVTARVTDDSGHVAEVKALVNDGTWRPLDLTQSSQDPTLWSGTISVSKDPEVFVEATDGVNVSYSANKGLNFTSTNSNTPPGGAQILVQAPVGPYALNQTVNATYSCGSAAQCKGTVDSKPVDSGNPINTSTFGAHTFVVQALDGDGNVIGSLQRTYFVQYPFNGFFAPVDNEPVINVTKGGSAIPVIFGLGGNQGLNIFASGYPKSQLIACDATAPADGIDSTVSAGGSSLSYDASSNRYTYVWKTDKSWVGTCRALILKMQDGTTHRADFKFK